MLKPKKEGRNLLPSKLSAALHGIVQLKMLVSIINDLRVPKGIQMVQKAESGTSKGDN